MSYEMQITAKAYLECSGNWDCTLEKILASNLLQKNKLSTQKREFKEFKIRLMHLNNEEIKFLSEGIFEKEIAFLSCIKSYTLLREFVLEVIRNKKLLFDNIIFESDWNNFFESKKEKSRKLANVSEYTQKKIKQVIFKILKDAQIIRIVKKQKIIEDIYLDKQFIEIVCRDNPSLLKLFLISDTDIKNYCR